MPRKAVAVLQRGAIPPLWTRPTWCDREPPERCGRGGGVQSSKPCDEEPADIKRRQRPGKPTRTEYRINTVGQLTDTDERAIASRSPTATSAVRADSSIRPFPTVETLIRRF